MCFYIMSFVILGIKLDIFDFVEELYEDLLVYRVLKVLGVGNWNFYVGF